MELVDAKDYRVRENWLYFPELPLNPVQIPFGLGLAERPRLQLDHQGREITRLKVQIAGSWRPVLPAFSRRVAGVNRGAPTITIETGIADWQRSAARTLVARTHYLTPRGTGVILLARIEDIAMAKEMRAKWWGRQSPEVKARLGGSIELATGGLANVVGAIHLERLMHGHPAGRNAIYAAEGKSPPKLPSIGEQPGFRRKVVTGLGLYWISRVAVDAPFQRCGAGSALCDAAREVAADWMPLPGRYVELIRRMPRSTFEGLKAGKGDFLTGHSAVFDVSLPYSLCPSHLSRRPGQSWNEELGRSELVLASPENLHPGGDCLVYYHAKAGRMVVGAASRTAALQTVSSQTVSRKGSSR